MTVPRSLTIGAILLLAATAALPQDKGKQGKAPAGPGMTLTSTAFTDGGEIPAKYSQSVPEPVSPKLDWTNVPPNTVSFALILRDPDVAVQRRTEDNLHWLIFNIPGDARELPENVPAAPTSATGVQIKNVGGVNGYRGPGAPAVGPYHHYTFELFALDTKLDLGPDATRADVLKAMDGHINAKAVTEGRFHR